MSNPNVYPFPFIRFYQWLSAESLLLNSLRTYSYGKKKRRDKSFAINKIVLSLANDLFIIGRLSIFVRQNDMIKVITMLDGVIDKQESYRAYLRRQEKKMGIFDIDDQKLRNLYKRAWIEANHGFVDPHKYPYLNRALIQYAREHQCSFDQALRIAKSIR